MTASSVSRALGAAAGLAALTSAAPVSAQQSFTIPMTCFPSPPVVGTQSPPPCPVPGGVDAKFVSPSPDGEAVLTVFPDDTATVEITLEGLAPDLVLTAWASYFFPPGPSPDPIFLTTAAVSAPLAPTTAGYTEGLGLEPNQFVADPNDPSRATLNVTLDYNPLKPNQGPLRNNTTTTHQILALPGTGAEQPPCCLTAVTPSPIQAVGSSLLRVFEPLIDPDTGLPGATPGFQALEPDGRAKLRRSPVAVDFLAIIIHIDETTHGINPGVPIIPRPAASVTDGDHFLLGMFDFPNS